MNATLRNLLVTASLGCALALVAHGQTPAPAAAKPPPAPDLASNPAAERGRIDPTLPTIFVAGDSTAARGKGEIQQGWAVPFADYFDPGKVNVVNRARGGRSSRTFVSEGLWDQLLADLKAGDIVLIQFGHNDGGAINEEPPGSKRPLRARASLPGLGEESQEIDNVFTKRHEVVHTFGWYIRKMIADTRAKGATPIVLSLTVRNLWPEGRLERGSGQYGAWSAEIAQVAGVAFVDLTNLVADQLEPLGEAKGKEIFQQDYVHFNAIGADLHAASVVAGLKALSPSPVAKFLSAKGEAVAAADAKYVRANAPRVALPLKSSDVPRLTQIGAGKPAPGALIDPAVPADPRLPSLVLIGDSTVRNGVQGDGSEKGQWGWGAPLTAFFDLTRINLVNRALGGTSSRSYYNTLWPGTLAVVKPGDVVILQFGHNDNNNLANDPRARATLPGIGEETQPSGAATVHTYGWYLRQYVKEIRAKGATPIICSLIPRRRWEADGRVKRDLASHAGWAAQVAKAENVDFIDLNELIARRYDELGREKVLPLFSPEATEATHTGWDGAVLNAEIVVSGLKALKDDPLAPYFSAVAQGIPPADLSQPVPVPKPLPASAAAAPAPKL
ncbi:MAG TPA: rhamnogalacturonan acetylesterase [Opitutaceae bacterium]|nr:rhamnogalacturonan acetylesterase [Opitutaceae bacterium]